MADFRTCLFSLLFFLTVLNNGNTQVLINEFSAANHEQFTDNYGENEDWIELYNTGNAAVDLSGYYLSDRVTNPTKWQIPAGTVIQAFGYLRFWASGNDVTVGQHIHTGFKITQTRNAEAVVFADPGGIIIDSHEIEVSNQRHHSWGRKTDGAPEWGIFTNPSPNAANSNAYDAYATKPVMSPEAGFYTGSVSVTLSSPDPNVSIYYTTNGAAPTPSSNLYNGPITISTTTVLKAIAVADDPNIVASHMDYHTYFIDEMHTIPVVSIAGEQVDNLVNGSASLRPIGSFELFNENGERVSDATGEFNKHGNDSWAYAQRGIDYITRDQFGDDYAIKTEVFPTYTNRDRFQRLILKAAANDNYPFADGAHIRDAYVHALSARAGLEMDERTYEPCVLYVNGDYWGVYELREKVDDHDFTEHYYNQDEEDIDFIKTWGGTWAEYGSAADFNDLVDFILANDMTDAGNYAYVEERLEVLSLIDYMILHSFNVSSDWLNWNTAWWRGRNPAGGAQKWRYILWDEDATFGHYINYTGIPDQSPLADPCDPEILGNPGGQGHVPILNALLENEDFFAVYINRYADLNNHFFNCDYAISFLDSLIDRITPEMSRHVDRWGGSMNGWETNVQELRDFMLERCVILDEGIVDCYEDEGITGPFDVVIEVFPENSGKVKANTAIGQNYPWTTTYFGGIEITLTALPEPLWGFDHWEVANNIFAPDEFALAITMSLETNDNITAVFYDLCAGITIDPVIEGPESICDGSTAFLTVNAFDTYTWSTGETAAAITIDTAGMYSVTVTNMDGCPGVDSFTVELSPGPEPEISGNTAICTGSSTTLNAGSFESYLWSNDATTPEITIDLPGVYSVTVTNAENCQGETSILVEETDFLEPEISGAASFCAGSSTTLDAGIYDHYLWSNADTVQNISVTTPGDYTVTVTDNNNCSGEATISITENPLPEPAISGEVSFCAGSSTILETGTFENYLWSTDETEQMITIAAPGDYSVTVTDDNNCTGEATISVEENPNPEPQISGEFSFCEGSVTSLDAGTYENYLWSNDETNSIIEVNAAGAYSVTVTDENNCSGETTVTVEENINPEPEISGLATFCEGSSTELDAGAGFNSYLWSNDENAQIIEVDASGSYTVTVTDANNCTGVATLTVSEEESLQPEIIGSQTFCEGSSTTLLGSNGFETYLWSDNSNAQMFTVTVEGTYGLTVTDASGCTGETEIVVTTNDQLFPFISGETTFCEEGSTILDAGVFDNYLWSNDETTQGIEVSTSGIYSVTVTDDNGCSGETEVIVEVLGNPEPEISGDAGFCAGSSTTLQTGSFANYLWSNNEMSQSITVNESGTYLVTVTNNDNCSAMASFTVEEYNNPEPEIAGVNAFCAGGSTILNAGTYEQYQWSTNESTTNITVNIAGNYSVTVTDTNNCTGAAGIEIEELDNPEPEISGIPGFCAGSSTVLAAGAFENYLWSTNESTAEIEVNAAADYTVTVTDSNGCTGTASLSVAAFDDPEPVISGENTFCEGNSTILNGGTGFIIYEWSNGSEGQSLVVSNEGLYILTVTDANGCTGTAEMTVMINEISETEETVELCYGGTYNGQTYFQDSNLGFIEQDQNGCDSIHTVYIEVAPEIEIELFVEDDCISEGASAIASANGGNGNYTYLWSNNGSGPIQENLPQGTYSVTVTDDFGCESEASVFVDPVASLVFDYDVQHVSCFGENDGSINLNILSGVGPFSVEWSGGETTENLENLPPGDYTVFVSDANGCLVATTITVAEPVLLQVSVSTSPASNGDNGSALANVSGGTTPYTYQWSNGSNDPFIDDLAAGTYTVTIIDANGCEAEQSFEINISTGIYDPESLVAMELYPNPSDGRFVVDLEFSTIETIKLSVLNVLGQQVLRTAEQNGTTFQLPVDISNQAAGTYLVVVETAKGKVFRKVELGG